MAPGAMARARRYAPVPLDALADTGEPVDAPPPMIEPMTIGFDEPPRPALEALRRKPVPPPLAPTPQEAPPHETPRRADFLNPLRATRSPELRAPLNEIRPQEDLAPLSRTPQMLTRLLALAQQWRGAVALPRLGDWRRLGQWGRWAAAAVVIIAIGYAAGFGLFSRPVHRSVAPLANAPSDPAQRLAYFQRGAQAGDPEAELQLAILYAKGEGVTQDYAIAAKWFRAAAEQGLARAQYDLGVLYERGRGVPTDAAQAASWYRKAADGKYPLAQYNLAVAYTKGEGTRKDPTEAALWYRRAASQGVVQAMVNLGMLYERGEGVPVSPVDAYAWYLTAARRGNDPAAKRADDLFGVLSAQEQIRAQKLASDIAASIHDPAPEAPRGG
ncbi:MAG TPA: tetratricopeptide repeat protein [Stellaceae bacterium]|nr:tetratricopeptide repeat protein [Stellaceae bacterium]